MGERSGFTESTPCVSIDRIHHRSCSRIDVNRNAVNSIGVGDRCIGKGVDDDIENGSRWPMCVSSGSRRNHVVDFDEDVLVVLVGTHRWEIEIDRSVSVVVYAILLPVIEQRIAAQPESPVDALLAIRVIDPACGSGHFLLAAARRLAEKLAQLRATDGEQTEQDFRHALREVVSRCIFGVDRNPMAIELARTALWLEGFEEGRPLGFLDHHLQVGDALLGLSDLKALELGIPKYAFKALSGDDKETCKALTADNTRFLKRSTSQTSHTLSGGLELNETDNTGLAYLKKLEAMPENTVQDIALKDQAFRTFLDQAKNGALAQAADCLVGAFLLPKGAPAKNTIPMTDTLIRLRASQTLDPTDQAKLAAAQTVCTQARVLHWPLAFPQVFAGGGFDCVLGNPPWEVMQMGEEEFFATRAPHIAELAGDKRKRAIAALPQNEPRLWAEYESESQRVAAANNFVRESGRYPLTAVGKLNTYPLFAETIYQITHNTGRAGFIVPTGIATDDSTKAFFGEITQKGRLISLFDIENREAVFPSVHRSYKFCLLTLGAAQAAEFVYFATQVSQLAEPRRRFTLTPDEFHLINPNTLTCPVFRSERDAELTKKLYRAAPVLIREAIWQGEGKTAKLIQPEENPWEISFSQGLFNMTSDSHLFLDKPATDHVPLYEAKMIHQFEHRWATYTAEGDSRDVTQAEKADTAYAVTPRYWVDKTEVEERLVKRDRDGNVIWRWEPGWLMGWRDITNATNERTVIASVVPRVGVGNNLPLMLFEERENPHEYAALLANLCALSFDFIARHKTGGTHMNYFIYKQLPVLPPNHYTEADLAFIVPRVLELTYTAHDLQPWAQDLGFDGEPFVFNPTRRATLRAELDAYYAKLYGLNRDELRYILDPADIMGEDYPSETFRVLKKNEEHEFGEYRTQRLVLAAWDKLEIGELH